MKKTNFTTRAFVQKNGQIMIRVRWCNKKNEVGLSVGYTIDPLKWDSAKQIVKSNTTHKIGGKTIYAREINNSIRDFLICIEEVFAEYDFHSKIPTKEELKEQVNTKLGRGKEEIIEEQKDKTLKDIFDEFLELRPLEGRWSKQAQYKYGQIWNQLMACDPHITLESLTKPKMLELVNWYIKNDYQNYTIAICFMAFTSLRYSDLAALRPVNIVDGRLEICTEKTDDKLFITLNEHAQNIIDKYSWYQGETVFPVPSNQKLNDYLKEAAKVAGLDREIVQIYFKGNKRCEDTYKFWEQISCHDARRTFVCCSLALGIPASVVMSCTGHSDYESMKPYIEVADETQKIQMEKWNSHQYKQEILESVDKMTTEQLKEVCKFINRKIKNIA